MTPHPTSRLLITGADGQLGRDCMEVLARFGDPIALTLADGDLANPTECARLLDERAPTTIVNCAAFTAVDRCETEPAVAEAGNVTLPRNLADWCAKRGASLIHISTDYVFAGDRPIGTDTTEDDPTGPLSVYGRTKLAGEDAVRAAAPRWAILRTSWLYGRHGHNFLKTMLRLALRDDLPVVRVVDDQWGNPTWSWTLAGQIAVVLDRGLTGVYHATGIGATTWCRLARAFVTRMGVPDKIVPCSSDEYPTPTKRPANSALAKAAFDRAGANAMRPWEEDLDEYVARHGEALLAEARAALAR